MDKNIQEHQQLLAVVISAEHRYPEDRFRGRGIVICGGGVRYFTCAWVCIKMLRKLGCQLPVQLWHLGANEMSDEMRALASSLGVECVDGKEIAKCHPVRTLHGWEAKPFAIIHSPFREVLFLDADNVPVVNPEYLFETSQYKECGAIFWPDYSRLGPKRSIWRICDVEYRDEPEFESGQIVVNKAKCWKALQVTMHLNEYSDFYYKHIHGDKETFHIAFRKMNTPYAMPTKGIHSLEATMCQHDFDGRRIFQHRNMAKWSLFNGNDRIEGFQFEEDCFAFLSELRAKWNELPGGVRRFKPSAKSQHEIAVGTKITRTVYDYHRVGYDRRRLSFKDDGTVGKGRAGCEVFWDVSETSDGWVLDISSEYELTCSLKADDSGAWRGRWLRFEKMPIELTPLGA